MNPWSGTGKKFLENIVLTRDLISSQNILNKYFKEYNEGVNAKNIYIFGDKGHTTQLQHILQEKLKLIRTDFDFVNERIKLFQLSSTAYRGPDNMSPLAQWLHYVVKTDQTHLISLQQLMTNLKG